MIARRTVAAGTMTLALLACSPAGERAPAIEVSNGWTREIAPGQTSAAIYLTIANSGAGSERLTGAQSPLGRAGLHTTSNSGGIARMRPLDGIDIAPGSTVELRPGGTHIMLTGLRQRPAQGDTIPLTLQFQRSGARAVAIRVSGAAVDAQSGLGMKM